MRQFSEAELQEFGAFLLTQLQETGKNAEYARMQLGEIVSLALADWLDEKKKSLKDLS
jgi:hypothetical protein